MALYIQNTLEKKKKDSMSVIGNAVGMRAS